MPDAMTREYRTIDKSAWGDGPWHQEPDKLSWTDEATGLPCLVVRGPSGALCGYVGVAEGHPCYKVDYNEVDLPDGVHGDLTYSDLCQAGPEEQAICHIPEPGQPDHVWWFGFDCAHAGDYSPSSSRRTNFSRLFLEGDASSVRETYRDLAYVREQVAELARQLVAVTGMETPNA